MRYCLFPLVLVLYVNNINSQSDSTKAELYLDSAIAFLNTEPESSISFAKKAHNNFRLFQDTLSMIYIDYIISEAYDRLGHINKSFEYANRAYSLRHLYREDYTDLYLTITIRYHYSHWKLYNDISDIFIIQKITDQLSNFDVSNSFNCSLKALLSLLYNEIGDIFNTYSNSETCLLKCRNHIESTLTCLLNKALVKFRPHCHECHKKEINEIIDVCKISNHYTVCQELPHILGRMEFQKKNYEKSYQLILQNIDSGINPSMKFHQLLLMSQICQYLNDQKSASLWIKAAHKSLNQDLKNNDLHLLELHLHISKHYVHFNILDSAHFHQETALELMSKEKENSYNRRGSIRSQILVHSLIMSCLKDQHSCEEMTLLTEQLYESTQSWINQISDRYSRKITYERLRKDISRVLSLIQSNNKWSHCRLDALSHTVDLLNCKEIEVVVNLFGPKHIISRDDRIEYIRALRNLKKYEFDTDLFFSTIKKIKLLENQNIIYKNNRHKIFKFEHTNLSLHIFSEDNNLYSILRNSSDLFIKAINPSLLHPDSSHTLYKKIFPENFDWSQYDQLTIVPDGPFHKYSFESMLTDDIPYDHPRDAPYLIKKIPISYSLGLHLARDFSEFDNESVRSVTFAPSFDQEGITSTRDCNEDNYGQLKCNQKEAQEVANILDGEAFLNKTATVANFKQNVDKYNFFHLATHACIDTNNYFESSLIFQDGRLPMSELYETDWNNKTVVLSACNTAKGAHVNGEGIFNFARTLTELGCKEVIVSLWPIDDCGTRDFIKLFYSHIQEGETTAKALQSARLKYLETADKLHAQPHFWAPLILISNDLNVGQTNNPSYVVWIVLLCLSILISSLYLFSAVRNKRTS